jgi:hypothetical protein
MKRLLLVACTLAMAALVPAAAMADWMEGFETYAPGTSLHGVGGWQGWNNDPAATAYVSNLYAHGGTNSVAITGASDLVQRYNGYDSGTWTYTAWMYMPANFTGQTYFILVNTYPATANQHWSVQVYFQNGQVVNSGLTGGTLPWILGQWVELRLEIDLVNDLQIFYYGGNVLYTATWTGEQVAGGALNIAAVDLYANSASPVYYDDMSLASGSVAVEHTTWGNVKSLFN